MHRFAVRLTTVLALCLCSVVSLAQQITVRSNKPGSVYAVGEPIVWRLVTRGKGAEKITEIKYVLKRNGQTEIASGSLS